MNVFVAVDLEFIADAPLNSFARRALVRAYVEMGRMEEASAERKVTIKTYPQPPSQPPPPPEAFWKFSPWKDPKVTERWIEADRKLRSYMLSQQ